MDDATLNRISSDGSADLTWAGEERRFRLRLKQLRELQEKINRPRVAIGATPIGPKTLFSIIAAGDAWPDEIREVLRLGLIGGGMTPIDQVPGLLARYFDDRPLHESADVAMVVLLAAMTGPKDDPVGKKPEAGTSGTSSPSPSFTVPGAPSDSRLDRSMN